LILFHGKRHRGELAEAEVSALATHLAVRLRVGVSGNSSGAPAPNSPQPASSGRWCGRSAKKGLYYGHSVHFDSRTSIVR
jgi:hypothetical protein